MDLCTYLIVCPRSLDPYPTGSWVQKDIRGLERGTISNPDLRLLRAPQYQIQDLVGILGPLEFGWFFFNGPVLERAYVRRIFIRFYRFNRFLLYLMWKTESLEPRINQSPVLPLYQSPVPMLRHKTSRHITSSPLDTCLIFSGKKDFGSRAKRHKTSQKVIKWARRAFRASIKTTDNIKCQFCEI